MKRWPGYTLDQQIGVIFNRVVPLSSKQAINPRSSAGRKTKRTKTRVASSTHDDAGGDGTGDDVNDIVNGLLEGEEGEQSDEEIEPSFLVNCPEERSRNVQRGGRPPSDILDQSTICCYKESEPGIIIWRCWGKGCTHTFSRRGKDRVFKHARVCTKLTPGLQGKVRLQSAQCAPSLKVERGVEGVEGSGKGKTR